jgi:hypothetical protein
MLLCCAVLCIVAHAVYMGCAGDPAHVAWLSRHLKDSSRGASQQPAARKVCQTPANGDGGVWPPACPLTDVGGGVSSNSVL